MSAAKPVAPQASVAPGASAARADLGTAATAASTPTVIASLRMPKAASVVAPVVLLRVMRSLNIVRLLGFT